MAYDLLKTLKSNLMQDYLIDGIGSLSFIPDEYIENLTCHVSLRHHACNIDFIPERYKSADMYKSAVDVGYPIEDVPKKYMSYGTVFTALHFNPDAKQNRFLYGTNPIDAKNIPKELYDDELAYRVCIANGANLKYIPKELRNIFLCNVVITLHKKGSERVMEHVPVEHLDKLIPIHLKYSNKIIRDLIGVNNKKVREIVAKYLVLFDIKDPFDIDEELGKRIIVDDRIVKYKSISGLVG